MCLKVIERIYFVVSYQYIVEFKILICQIWHFNDRTCNMCFWHWIVSYSFFCPSRHFAATMSHNLTLRLLSLQFSRHSLLHRTKLSPQVTWAVTQLWHCRWRRRVKF